MAEEEGRGQSRRRKYTSSYAGYARLQRSASYIFIRHGQLFIKVLHNFYCHGLFSHTIILFFGGAY